MYWVELYHNKRTRLLSLDTHLQSSLWPFSTTLKHKLWIYFTIFNFLPNGMKSHIMSNLMCDTLDSLENDIFAKSTFVYVK